MKFKIQLEKDRKYDQQLFDPSWVSKTSCNFFRQLFFDLHVLFPNELYPGYEIQKTTLRYIFV